MSGQISLPWKTYHDGGSRLRFVERLTAALAGQPGIDLAGIVTNVPLSGESGKSAATVKGHGLKPGQASHGIYSYAVGGEYFEE